MNKLLIDGEKPNHFYKSLFFQAVEDMEDLNKYERALLHTISRKTLHFDKQRDNLAVSWISKKNGIGRKKVTKTIRSLEEKKLIYVKWSKGGKTNDKSKYHEFALHRNIILNVYMTWEKAKEQLESY